MIDPPLVSPFTERRILKLAQGCLEEAGVVGELPTPAEAVGRAAGLMEVVSIEALPADVTARKPAALRRLLGAVMFAEKVAFIDDSQDEARRRFTEFHEAAHLLLPWHESTFFLDDDQRLLGKTREHLEAEANLCGAHLMFQNGLLHRLAAESQIGLSAALSVAGQFGASRHAALHYYAEHHPTAAMALLISGRIPRWNGDLPIWRSVCSPAFRARFGDLVDLLPRRSLATVGPDAIFGEALDAARRTTVPIAQAVVLPERGGNVRAFTAEAWSNGRTMFVLATERSARRLGRRVKLAS